MSYPIRELTIQDLAYFCPEHLLTDSLAAPTTLGDENPVVGQQEPLTHLETAGRARVEHIYVSGVPGTGRTGLTIATLKKLAQTMPVPGDLCYVQNFTEPTKPRKLVLPPGQGRKLADALKAAIRSLRRGLDQRLKSEEVESAQTAIKREFDERMRQELVRVEKLAQEMGLTLRRTEMGLIAVPLPGEKGPMESDSGRQDPAEANPLPEEQARAEKPETEKEGEEKVEAEAKEASDHGRPVRNLEESATLIRQAIAEAWRRIEKMQQELTEQLEAVTEQVIVDFVTEIMTPLIEEWSEPAVAEFLRDLLADLKEQIPLLRAAVAEGSVDTSDLRRFWQRYEVNCLVLRDPQAGAPVVYEPNPTYYNVFGEQEYYTDGRVAVTNHMFLRSGAIHRANGGWLVLPVLEVLTNFQTWSSLKQALKRRRVGFGNLGADLRLIPVGTLEPEEVELDLQVVLVGTPDVYHMLYRLDPDFAELFRYKVEFVDRIPLSVAAVKEYGRYIAQACREDVLPSCSPGAAARLVEYGVRMTGNKTKLSTRMGEIRALLREAAAWTRLKGRDAISSMDVLAVIKQREERGDLAWRRLLEQIKRGQLLIQTTGTAVGEINGLAVYDLGDLQFARPVKITANTFLGQQGLTHIEREIRLSGKIHSKGVLTIAGYFGAKYGQKRPVSLSASICFEQSYGEIEGDSASAAELLALLSSISSVPFRQDLAITGSVNQKGRIQPVGGVTTKVEGYFRVCQLFGLTGSQGVVIPAANVENLVLHREVLQAIREGLFHIYPITDIDEGISLFVDNELGITADELHRRVERRLDEWRKLAQPIDCKTGADVSLDAEEQAGS